MGGQRPGPYDRPMMSGPRGGFFGPGSGRAGGLMDNMRSGGGYGGGMKKFAFMHRFSKTRPKKTAYCNRNKQTVLLYHVVCFLCVIIMLKPF